MQNVKNYRYTRGIYLCLALVLTFFISTSHALGGKVKRFSAEMYTTTPDGKDMTIGHIYVTPDASRMDMEQGMGGPDAPPMDISTLTFTKDKKQYIYNHTKKLVYEGTEEDEKLFKGFAQELKNIQSEKVLGNEKVEGYKCDKKEVVTSIQIIGMTHKSTQIVWQSDKFDFPIKQQGEDGEISGMRKIKKGKPSAKLFAPLTGYTKVNNIMAVMGMDIAAMMAEDEPPAQSPDNTNQDPADSMDEIQKNLEQIAPEAKEMMKGLFDKFKPQ